MAKLDFTNVSELDLSNGIDVRSAENLLSPGFAEDILNGEIVEKRVRKRVGYQGFAGHVPVRVTQVDYINGASNNIQFKLDAAIELGNVRSTPIIAHGRLSEAGNPSNVGKFKYDSDNTEYYPEFSADARKAVSIGSGTIAIPADEHGLGTDLLFVGITESLAAANQSNQVFIPDLVEIDQGTFDVDIGYTVGSSKSFLVYFSKKTAVSGSVFVSTPTSVPVGTQTLNIPAGTHGLANLQIVAQVFEDTGSLNRRILPNKVTIDQATGDIDIEIINSTSGAFDAFVILSAVPVANFRTVELAAGATGSVTISAPDTPFPFLGIYEELTVGGDLESVIPDLIEYDSVTDVLEVTFTNKSATTHRFEVYYEFGNIITNKLTVTSSVNPGTNLSDTNPQITLWGLCHEQIYGDDKAGREGWVNHIDSYIREAEQRIVCGLGGNIFTAQEYSEAAATYLYGSLLPNLRNRVSVDRVIAPLFQSTAVVPAGATPVLRSRGYIAANGADDNFVEVESATYNSSTGYVDYLLKVPGKLINDSANAATTLSSVIDVTVDQLTVAGMGFSKLNGTFDIRAVDDTSATTITVSVSNAAVKDSYTDEVDAGGRAGVFTDQLPLLTSSEFTPGDVLLSGSFSESQLLTVTSTTTSTVTFSGLFDRISIPSGLRIVGRRQSRVIPLRDTDDLDSVVNFVQGDMVTYTNIARELRVKSVNPESDISITITGTGSEATVTLSGADTSTFGEGRYITLVRAGNFTGTHQITLINDTTTLTIDTAVTGSGVSGVILGKTIEIDENLEWEDSNSDATELIVNRRWIPVEIPQDSYELTPNTRPRHFDSETYTNQSFLRSTMVNDTLFLTNGEDEVMKFDGTSIYRAGLFRWQPGLFAQVDESAGGIVAGNVSVSYSASSGNIFTIAIADKLKLTVGDVIQDSINSAFYTITDIEEDLGTSPPTTAKVKVSSTITSTFAGTPTLKQTSTFRYYFRLNAVDANNNIVASAATGSQDFRVRLGANAAIQLRLVGMPAWDVYDYDRLEVEIYRTQKNTQAPFYKLVTVPMQFDNGTGYIDYTDTRDDTTLIDLDVVNTALLGTEIGTTWADPIRAKYVSSSGSRLILANLTDYPELDVQIEVSENEANLTTSDLGGKKWLLRRDETDTGTTTDMINRVTYEWKSSGTGTFTPASDITNNSGTSFDVDLGTSVLIGDWVYLYHTASGNKSNEYAGWWQVKDVSGTVATFTHVHDSGYTPSSADVDGFVTASSPEDVPVFIGDDYNSDALEYNTTTTRIRTVERLVNAINATMRQTDTSITSMADFTPWVIASGGGEFRGGQFVLRQPRANTAVMEMVVPTGITGVIDVYVNGDRVSAGSSLSAPSRVFPSRLCISYPNFPEIFDAPTTILAQDSDSAVDVNAADGQEITGIIPFFAISSTTDSSHEAVMLVFKTNSVYVLNPDTRQIRRLDTRGVGCTAPYSIAATQNGIMFASDSGIYKIDRTLQLRYIGRGMERRWLESVNRTQLDLCQGTHFAIGRQYKLSVPVGTDTQNSQVYVYDHSKDVLTDGTSGGAWSRFDNHPTTGWANLARDAFFASTNGRVFSLRRAGNETDYRDDDAAITFDFLYRAIDFGLGSVRKAVASIVSHFRASARSTGTSLSVAADLSRSFETTTTFTIDQNMDVDNLSDANDSKVVSMRHSLGRRRLLYLQPRWTNSTIDEPVELAGMSFGVASLDPGKGILEAADTGD